MQFKKVSKVWFSNVACWRSDWQLTKLYEIGYMWDKIVEITGRCIWFLYHGHLKFGRVSIKQKNQISNMTVGHRKWAWKKWIETLTWFITYLNCLHRQFFVFLRLQNNFYFFFTFLVCQLQTSERKCVIFVYKFYWDKARLCSTYVHMQRFRER